MSISFYGLNNYASMFTSPVKPYEVNPVTNLLYGNTAGTIYKNTVSKKLKSIASGYISSMKTSAAELISSAKQLQSSEKATVFNAKKAANANSDAILIRTNAEARSNNSNPVTHNIKVLQLALSQTNNGKELKTSDRSEFKPGINMFTIKSGNYEKRLSVDISENDTNGEGLQKFAKAVNLAKVGIRAEVMTNQNAGTSYLSLTAERTGKENSFQITDNYDGNITEKSLANRVERASRNAEYTIDNKTFTSPGNSIKLDNGNTEITFQKTSANDIRINIERDLAAVKDQINAFINDYNNVINMGNTYSKIGYFQSPQMLDAIYEPSKNELQKIGVLQNRDSTLSVDEITLDKALTQNFNAVKSAFGGNNGFADKVASFAQRMQTAPQQFMNTPSSVIRDYRGLYLDVML